MKGEPPATTSHRPLKIYEIGPSAKPRGSVREPTSDAGGKRGPHQQVEVAQAIAVAAAAAPQRTGYDVCVDAETAEAVPLETVTAESESTIDLHAEMYLSKILPDPATIVSTERASVQAASCGDHTYARCEEPPIPPPQRRHGEHVAVDERVVSNAESGRWSSLLPVGTVVRRPSVKLVQLVAQAIHESPHRVLRVAHIYAALQNRYPYFRLQDKEGISSWKSSVRHALFQKWFVKLRPTSRMGETVKRKSFFWGLNYENRPREWQMPRGVPRVFLPTDDEGEQRNDEQSTLFSGLHVNTQPPSKTTTARLPSAFRLELEAELFPPPQPQSPGRKRKLSAVQCREFAPVTSAPQSVDDLVSVGSPPSSLPHIAAADFKSESMNPVGWPAPGRAEEHAWQQPSVIASAAPPDIWDVVYCKAPSAASFTTTTTTTATMTSPPASAALVEAIVESFQKPRQSLSGEQFLQLQQEEQQQVMQQPLQEPPQQQQQQLLQMVQAPLQESEQEQDGVPQDSLRLMDAGSPDNLFDDDRTDPEDMYYEEPLAPCPLLCSPSLIRQTSPSQTPLLTWSSTRAPTPSQCPPAIPGPSQTPHA